MSGKPSSTRPLKAVALVAVLLASVFAAQAGVFDEVVFGLGADPDQECLDAHGYDFGSGGERDPFADAGHGYRFGYNRGGEFAGGYGYGWATIEGDGYGYVVDLSLIHI